MSTVMSSVRVMSAIGCVPTNGWAARGLTDGRRILAGGDKDMRCQGCPIDETETAMDERRGRHCNGGLPAFLGLGGGGIMMSIWMADMREGRRARGEG